MADRQSDVFILDRNSDWQDLGGGIRRKLLGYNGAVMMARIEFQAGAVGTEHSHPHIQCSMVESGVFDITINGKTERLRTGDGFLVPADALHSAVAVEAGVLLDTFAPMREDFPGMNKRRVGVIGLGMASPPHIQSLLDLSDRVEVVGAFSPTPERRVAFTARYGLPVVETADALFDDPAVSALVVLAPPDSHLDLVKRAAEAGKHVLLEKPLAETPAGAAEVVEVMERAGLTLGVVFQHRFRRAAEELRALLDAGVLGEPLTAAVSVRWWRDDAYYSQPGRGMKARDGGGVLLTQAIHTLDLFVSLLGLPSEVVGFSGTTPLRRIDTEDAVCAALRWPGGLMATVNATTAAYPGFPERIEIAGTKGSAVLSGDRLEAFPVGGEAIRIGADGGTLGGGADPMAFSHAHHRAVLADFLDALDQGRKPRADGHEALKVHRLIEMLLAS